MEIPISNISSNISNQSMDLSLTHTFLITWIIRRETISSSNSVKFCLVPFCSIDSTGSNQGISRMRHDQISADQENNFGTCQFQFQLNKIKRNKTGRLVMLLLSWMMENEHTKTMKQMKKLQRKVLMSVLKQRKRRLNKD